LLYLRFVQFTMTDEPSVLWTWYEKKYFTN